MLVISHFFKCLVSHRAWTKHISGGVISSLQFLQTNILSRSLQFFVACPTKWNETKLVLVVYEMIITNLYGTVKDGAY